jgi:UDP-N-acetylmuramyl pentapeptide phosphotransferase/UDP-N-acetylglucosamine-1-phosphate transferase
MVRVLVAGLVAMVIAVAVGPTFIEWLRRQSIGQHIREEGPASHMVKQGTRQTIHAWHAWRASGQHLRSRGRVK